MENPQRLARPRLPFKSEKMGVLTGMLLGDAGMTKKYPRNLTICHSEPQKEYFEWKCSILEHFGFKKNKVREMHSKLGNKAFLVDFVDDKFKYFFRKFYRNENDKRLTRIVNRQNLRHLNLYGLAIWFMDDGNLSKKDYPYVCLNTQAYTYEEHVLLQKFFKKKYNLDVKIHKDKHYFKLYFGQENNTAKRFVKMIEPYIHNSIEYKLR